MLAALDAAFDTVRPSPRLPSLALMYKRDWNGLVEGPYWTSWWIQNSLGTTYGLLPFLGEEPYASWIGNSQAMWFDHMGDGQRKDRRRLVGPDGCLCDHASYFMNGDASSGFGDPRFPPDAMRAVINGQIRFENVMYKQGDGKADADWYSGGAAAGLIMEADRLLVRHRAAEARYRLGNLKRVAAFLDSYCDPQRDLLMGCKGCNLLAPTYPGGRQKDGSMGKGYLTELSVNYVAGLERLAEVCVLCGEPEAAEKYRLTAQSVRRALPSLMTPEGYFIRAEDPDGTRRGIFGAAQHGYFEAHPNHDAGCFRVTDDAQNKTIVRYMLDRVKGLQAPGGLAPYGLILPNYPGYDDHPGEGNMTYGTWNNGGGWPANQALMDVAAMRAGEFTHPFGAWEVMHRMMEGFRADAPLAGWGRFPGAVPQQHPYSLCYDAWGPSAGLMRGLFEYGYTANGLRLWPHIPPGIGRYVQKMPASFGQTRIHLATTGQGTPTAAFIDGQKVAMEANGFVFLPLDGTARHVTVEFLLGAAAPKGVPLVTPEPPASGDAALWPPPFAAASTFLAAMEKVGRADSFEAGQARVVIQTMNALYNRRRMLAAGQLHPPTLDGIKPCDQNGVDELYTAQARYLLGGLQDHLHGLSLWNLPVDPDVLKMARDAGLVQ